MTNEELLSKAAKAAGFLNWTPRGNGLFVETGHSRNNTGYHWNPIKDDGDALRLAVKLEFDIHQRVVGGTRYEVLPPGGPLTVEYYKTGSNDEAGVALRMAIVRAAALMADN